MASGGLSNIRLERMHRVLAAHVERGAVPGLVTLVSRHGNTHVDAIGTKVIGGDAEMQCDTIFRIASLITAAAVMILVEECELRLDDPVDDILPELGDRMVLKRIDSALDDTVPAERSITTRDLMTFTMGFGVVMAPPDTYPIQQAMVDLQLGGTGPPQPATQPPTDEWIRRLGSLPLMHQPGEQWMYHTGSDVLGVLIERVSGQPLETFLRQRIFDPLGMVDTGFSVPPEKLDRLPGCYEVSLEDGSLKVFDGVDDSQWRRPPPFPSGGGGLVSTVDDMLAFGQMMLNGGRLGFERVLSRLSVETMTADQLSPAQKAASEFSTGFFDNHGWGFGMEVVTRRYDVAAVPGRYGWVGGLGTSWFCDPHEDMVTILMMQLSAFPLLTPVFVDFWTSAYASIDD